MQPVLDVMVKAAQRFCGAEDVVIGLRNGDELIIAAHDGPILRPPSPRVLERTSTLGRAILDACTVHVPDTSQLDPAEWDVLIQLTQRAGVRSLLAAPMLKDGSAVGAIMLRRREAGAFTDRQAALLESFAAQAVIAIENVRLFTELRESLDQQTATADILRVISQSPTDVQPVLDVVAEAARRFCGANDVVIGIREGDELRIAAHEGPLGVPPERRALDRSSAQGRAVIDGRTVHVPDFTALDPAEWGKGLELSRTFGFNSAVAAPMLRDGQAVGTVFLRRPETGPFSERQVALLENFAAQAVIAIENVRLFTELRESLDQQTATSDILRVISQSPTDVTPVFDAIAERARVLCGALLGATTRFDGELMHLVGYHGVSPQAEAIMRSSFPRKPDPSSINGRCILARAPIQIPDVTADPHYQLQDAANAAEYRALVAVPMLQGSEVIGVIAVTRREPGAFPPKLVELLQTFAAQGVIAIENVRLFTELRDSLERLKAAQANLVQSEKMASLGQLTAGIAHEIKNPLNFVNNFATLSVDLLDELKEVAGPALATLDEEARAALDEVMELLTGNLTKIAEHGKRADGIVKSMLSHSRGGSGDWASSDINALVEEALNLAYHGARAQDKEFNVTLERELDKGCGPIEVVPQDVMRVFLNLFGNGFYAANKRRTRSREAGFRPTLRVATRDLGDAVEVCVRDNGIGMPPEVKAKLFQPFFTTKPTGEGTGLGLSISYDIVTQQHGGTIDVASEPDDYTEFTVRLPRARRTGAAARGA